MDQKQMKPEEAFKKIEEVIREIQNNDGSSGYAEQYLTANHQYIMYLLSKYPYHLHQLSDEMKNVLRDIVQDYLNWSFKGLW